MEQRRGNQRHVAIVAALAIVVMAAASGVARAAAAGSPDPSWGTDGSSQPLPYRYVTPRQIEVGPDGMAYLVSSHGDDPTSGQIHRYTPSGDLDPSFAVSLTSTPRPRIEIQPGADGYALVAVENGRLVRVTVDGEQDPTFASPSPRTRATTDVDVSATGNLIVALSARGAAGGYWVDGPNPCGWPCPYLGAGAVVQAGGQVVAMYDRDGRPEQRFAGGEVVFGAPSGYALGGGSCAVVTCVIVWAYVNDAGQLGVCVAVVCTPRLSGAAPFTATDVALDPEGGVFVGGVFRDPRQRDSHTPAVVHLLPDGTLDGSFGDHGVLLGHDGWAEGDTVEVLVDHDARLLVLHRTCDLGCVQQVVRLTGDHLDQTFSGGVVRLPGWASWSANLVEAPDGGIFAFRSDLGVTRLRSDGSIDTAFGTDGQVADPAGFARGGVDAAGRPYLSDRDSDGYVRVVRLLATATDTVIDDPADPALTGSVRDRQGVPIPGAAVDCAVASGMTDATGVYRIELPAGDYQCTASAAGYATRKQRVTVSDTGGSADFTLRRL